MKVGYILRVEEAGPGGDRPMTGDDPDVLVVLVEPSIAGYVPGLPPDAPPFRVRGAGRFRETGGALKAPSPQGPTA